MNQIRIDTRKPKRATLKELELLHPKIKLVIATAKQWSRRRSNGHPEASLVLVGANGVGKTHIARSVFWSICYKLDGEPVAPVGQFFTAYDLLDLLRVSNQVSELIPPPYPIDNGKYGGCPIVVIDDVGSEGVVPYVSADAQLTEIRNRYFRVINYCYEQKISLIMTSNLSLKKLAIHLGGRSWDRLCEMAPKGFMLEMFDVPSYRQKKGGRA